MVWDSRRFPEQIAYFLDESCCFFDEKILLPLGLTAAASAIDTIIQKKLVISLGYEKFRNPWNFIEKSYWNCCKWSERTTRKFFTNATWNHGASLLGDFWTRKAAIGTREEFMRAGQFSNAGSWLDKCYISIVFWK